MKPHPQLRSTGNGFHGITFPKPELPHVSNRQIAGFPERKK